LGADGLIHYRVVDEYEWWEFQVDPETSSSPLTMRQLVNLIDSVEWHPGDDEVEIGLTDAYRDGNFDGGDPEELLHFVRVTSTYYPGLRAHYERDAERWVDTKLVEAWNEGFACSCGLDAVEEEPPFGSHAEHCRTLTALRRREGTSGSN
jgi:hypothetical protein